MSSDLFVTPKKRQHSPALQRNYGYGDTRTRVSECVH